jgi:4-amino-4-deoxy-L-arabinose transferase-like glycosyltransferase
LRECLAPTLLSAVMLGVVLSAQPTLDGHEVLVAQTAREMLDSGDFIHPTFAGEPRLQKPPLAYWTCALSFTLFGESEWAARLPSALASVLGVFVTALFARRAFGPGMGWLAGSVQATCVWTIGYGRLALVDSMLTTLVSAAILVAAWDRLAPSDNNGRRRWIPPTFWTLCGLIVLAKGPVGLAMLLPPVILYRLVRDKNENDSPLLFHPSAMFGIVLFLFLSLAWPMAILNRHAEAFELWTGQSLGRFQEHWGPQTRPWWYFFVQTPWLLFPWGLAPIALASRRPQFQWREPNRLLLLAWFGTAFLLCSFSAGKRAHYILPGLPTACVLAALAVRTLAARRSRALSGALPFGSRLTLALPRCIGALALVEAFVFAFIIAPGQSHSGFRALAERNRDALQSAEVVQVGSRQRATIFPVDRPMRWLPAPPDANFERLLVITPEKKLPDLLATSRARIIDRIGADRSRNERSPSEAFALVELAPIR